MALNSFQPVCLYIYACSSVRKTDTIRTGLHTSTPLCCMGNRDTMTECIDAEYLRVGTGARYCCGGLEVTSHTFMLHPETWAARCVHTLHCVHTEKPTIRQCRRGARRTRGFFCVWERSKNEKPCSLPKTLHRRSTAVWRIEIEMDSMEGTREREKMKTIFLPRREFLAVEFG